MLAFISGVSCKLYDDLSDNPHIVQYKTEYLSELLKGIHYVSFTSISIKDPYFFLTSVIANISHYIYNKEAYSKPYESSLFISLLFIIFALEYKSVNFKLIDYFLLLSCCALLFLEPLCKFTEYSYLKMMGRGIALLWYILCCSMNVSPTVYHLYTYFIGYFLCSVICQGYSLFRKKKSHSKIKRAMTKELNQKIIIFNKWLSCMGTSFYIKDIQHAITIMIWLSIIYNLFMFYIYNF